MQGVGGSNAWILCSPQMLRICGAVFVERKFVEPALRRRSPCWKPPVWRERRGYDSTCWTGIAPWVNTCWASCSSPWNAVSTR